MGFTDSITYFCFTVAAFRTGCTLFPLSPRNSASAIKHLLSATGSKHLFVSPDLANQNLAAEALRMDTDGIRVKVLHTPCFEDAFPENDSAFVPEPATPVSIDDAAIVYHSSGERNRISFATIFRTFDQEQHPFPSRSTQNMYVEVEWFRTLNEMINFSVFLRARSSGLGSSEVSQIQIRQIDSVR